MLPECKRLAGPGGYTFQQDGARAHTARATLAYLNANVPDLMEPGIWPPKSPDLNPVDYCIWGMMENLVYRTKLRDQAHLREVLVDSWGQISQESIDRGIDQFRPRLRKLIEVEGKHIEQFF